jgi:hypothetical protein
MNCPMTFKNTSITRGISFLLLQSFVKYDHRGKWRVGGGGRKIDELNEFCLAHRFMQEDVVTEAGSRMSQSFFR